MPLQPLVYHTERFCCDRNGSSPSEVGEKRENEAIAAANRRKSRNNRTLDLATSSCRLFTQLKQTFPGSELGLFTGDRKRHFEPPVQCGELGIA